MILLAESAEFGFLNCFVDEMPVFGSPAISHGGGRFAFWSFDFFGVDHKPDDLFPGTRGAGGTFWTLLYTRY